VFLREHGSDRPGRERIAGRAAELAVQTWLEQASFYKSVKELYNRIFGALGLIIGVIVVFVVTNAMAMAIIERTREIGTCARWARCPASSHARSRSKGWCSAAPVRRGALLALAVSVALLMFPVEMPPPPGRSNGYPAADRHGSGAVCGDARGDGGPGDARVGLGRAAHGHGKPIVDALAHV
jgi:putative ABC transport system permease protein